MLTRLRNLLIGPPLPTGQIDEKKWEGLASLSFRGMKQNIVP